MAKGKPAEIPTWFAALLLAGMCLLAYWALKHANQVEKNRNPSPSPSPSVTASR